MTTTTANGKTAAADRIEIEQLPQATIFLPVVGTAPLLMHRFSEKAKRAMLDAVQGRKSQKEPKNPDDEYRAAFYRLPDGRPGLPALAFKAATIGAARFYSQLTMTALKQFIFFTGPIGSDGQQLVAIDGEPVMREDVVRIGRGGTELRYRPEFPHWSATLAITYISSMLTESSLVAIVDAGGLGIGVGDWRPEKGGNFGTFKVDPDAEIISAS
jgi:hypothetical protein